MTALTLSSDMFVGGRLHFLAKSEPLIFLPVANLPLITHLSA
jgi:hypothetical protein